MAVEIREPQMIDEWEAYFDVRWNVLRAPWNQLKGSEQDEFEKEAYHLMAIEGKGVLSVGRIHLPQPFVAQVRYMATVPDARGKGLGTRILQSLEEYVLGKDAKKIVLNARDEFRGFYEKRGYHFIGEGETLFGSVKHSKMEKEIKNE